MPEQGVKHGTEQRVEQGAEQGNENLLYYTIISALIFSVSHLHFVND
jgi:hypothetical protein